MYKYIEHDAIEVIKALNPRFPSIIFNDDYARVAFEDTVLNLPLFLHYGNNVNDLVADTINAIKLICGASKKLISFYLFL